MLNCLFPEFLSQGQLSRIASIYIPWLGIVLENLHRLQFVQENEIKTEIKQNGTNRVSTSSSFLTAKDSSISTATAGTPKSIHR